MITEIICLTDNRSFRLKYDSVHILDILTPEQRQSTLNQLNIHPTDVKSIEIQSPSFPSSLSFQQLAGSITITSPTSGVTWNAGTSYDIMWTSTGDAIGGNVLIELFKAGVECGQISCSTPNPSSTGSFTWSPSGINLQGSDYQIRITKLLTAYTDISPPFTINSTSLGKMNIVYPSCGDTLYVNSIYNITWTSFGNASGGTVDITLELSGSPISTIATSATNNGIYPWTIPSTQTTGSGFRIRVTKSGTSYTDNSNLPFAIATPLACNIPNCDFTATQI